MDKEIKKPIIFIGTGRSGSTVISGAIFSHKDIGYPSNYQQKFPRYTAINWLRRIFDNDLWRIYTRGGKRNWRNKFIFLPSEAYSMWDYITTPRIDFSRSFLHNEQATPKEAQKIHAYFHRLLAAQGKKRLGFKVTGPARINYLLSIFPDAQFIYVKRRIIPTLNSFLKVDFWQSRGAHRLWFTGAYNKEEIDWASAHSESPAQLTAFQLGRLDYITEQEIEKSKASVLSLDYEDFVHNPNRIISTILDFLHLEQDDACENYLQKNPVYNTTKADEAYFKPEELKKIYTAYAKGKYST